MINLHSRQHGNGHHRTGKALLPDVALAATYSILELPEWEEGYDELYYVRIDNGSFAVEPWKSGEEQTFHPEDNTFGRKVRKINTLLAGEASAVFSLALGRTAVFGMRKVNFLHV